MKLKDVIKKPLITEKTTQMAGLGQYSFLVDKRATKSEIARAVEDFFKVKVIRVRTAVYQQRKKAAVQLKEGDKIEAFSLEE